MKPQRKARVLGISAATALGLTMAFAATSTAAPPHPTAGDGQRAIAFPNAAGSRFYDNYVTGGPDSADFVIFAGAGLADYFPDYCIDGTEPGTVFGTFRVKPDGPLLAPGSTDRYWVDATRVPVEVYEYADGDAYNFLDQVCEDGLPQAYASGLGILWVRGTSEYVFDDAIGGTYAMRHEENGMRASLTAADGSRVQVSGYATFDYGVNHPGTPSEEWVFFGPPDVVTADVWGGQ